MTSYLYVLLIGDHPHAGTRGRIPMDAQGKITVSTFLGTRMVLVELIDSPLMTPTAYAEARHIGRVIPLVAQRLQTGVKP